MLAFPESPSTIDITLPHILHQCQPMPMCNCGPANNNSSSSMVTWKYHEDASPNLQTRSSSPITRETWLASTSEPFAELAPLGQFFLTCPNFWQFHFCNPDCINTSLTFTFHKPKLILPSNFFQLALENFDIATVYWKKNKTSKHTLPDFLSATQLGVRKPTGQPAAMGWVGLGSRVGLGSKFSTRTLAGWVAGSEFFNPTQPASSHINFFYLVFLMYLYY